MESILRTRADVIETATTPAAASDPARRVEGAWRGGAPPPRTPLAPQKDSAAERRLKLIIEAAPVGLMITDPSAQLLAANRATLSLLGIGRLDALLGRNFGTVVAPADAEAFSAFVSSVCSGTPGSIAYEVIGEDGQRRTMETFATSIRREDGDSTAFLGATWDVTERKRSAAALMELESTYAAVESERNALAASLDEARRAAAEEREALAARLRAAEQQLTAEREGRRTALEEVDRQHQAALAPLRAERNKLAQTVQELTAAQAELVSQRTAERADSERALRAERSRCAQLLEERDARKTTLTDILRGSSETVERLQQLLGIAGTNIRLVSSTHQEGPLEDTSSPDSRAALDDGTPDEEDLSWQF